MALTGWLQVNARLTCHIFDDIPISFRNNFPSQFKRQETENGGVSARFKSPYFCEAGKSREARATQIFNKLALMPLF